MTARHQEEQPLDIPEPGPRYCHGTCGRILISRGSWDKFDRSDRRKLVGTHARAHTGYYCQPCHKEAHPPDEWAWPTDRWERRGLIMVPTGPRPIERESPNPLYRTNDIPLSLLPPLDPWEL